MRREEEKQTINAWCMLKGKQTSLSCASKHYTCSVCASLTDSHMLLCRLHAHMFQPLHLLTFEGSGTLRKLVS